MKLTVAGKKKEVKDGITVAELIEEEQIENPLYVTVTVNEEFLQRDDFETTKLKDGDEVEFLYFMGGGSVR
ncbi:MAG: sulfur carrier protein ThiS [Roseburia sp.]|nr:sulfur carrier protein ThiS [Roseburia sp.]